MAAKVKIKLKGRQLKDLQDKIILINYTIEKALTDCFIREEIFDLLESAREAGIDMERTLLL